MQHRRLDIRGSLARNVPLLKSGTYVHTAVHRIYTSLTTERLPAKQWYARLFSTDELLLRALPHCFRNPEPGDRILTRYAASPPEDGEFGLGMLREKVFGPVTRSFTDGAICFSEAVTFEHFANTIFSVTYFALLRRHLQDAWAIYKPALPSPLLQSISLQDAISDTNQSIVSLMATISEWKLNIDGTHSLLEKIMKVSEQDAPLTLSTYTRYEIDKQNAYREYIRKPENTAALQNFLLNLKEVSQKIEERINKWKSELARRVDALSTILHVEEDRLCKNRGYYVPLTVISATDRPPGFTDKDIHCMSREMIFYTQLMDNAAKLENLHLTILQGIEQSGVQKAGIDNLKNVDLMVIDGKEKTMLILALVGISKSKMIYPYHATEDEKTISRDNLWDTMETILVTHATCIEKFNTATEKRKKMYERLMSLRNDLKNYNSKMYVTREVAYYSIPMFTAKFEEWVTASLQRYLSQHDFSYMFGAPDRRDVIS